MNRTIPQINFTPMEESLYVAFELSRSRWTLALSTGQKSPSLVWVAAGDLGALGEAIARAKQRAGLPEGARVRSCYEAGRDGFWIDRWLKSVGIENLVVDSSSIEVNRRARRAKTDRLDARKLVSMLIRYFHGERGLWSVVRVPSVEEEDQRRLHREMERLKKEQTAHSNRIRGLLFLHGKDLEDKRDIAGALERCRLWDGSAIPPALKEELLREHQRLQLVRAQVRELVLQRRKRLKTIESTADAQVKKLMRLLGVGVESAWTNVYELFAWRQFRNRRQIAAAVGLAPMPHQSGDDATDQGISRAGNRRVRRMAIQIAWGWLRFQPKSELSRWFLRRFGGGSGRMKRIGIVALARRLLIALWRFLTQDVVPQGARLRPVSVR